MRSFLILAALPLVLYSGLAASQEDFTQWLQALKLEAQEAGISNQTASAVIEHIDYIPGVIKLDRAQPEFISPFFDYYYRRVDALKIEHGRELLKKHETLLNHLEMQYGVPKATLIAFWGMETNYGSYQGDIDTLSSLATLAYDGRRANFFRGQLLDAMRVIEAREADIDDFHGSWAGAFGHMQFMPTTLLTYAVDGDGNEHIDIVNSEADALASAANYLSQVGWNKNEPAMLEVQLPEGFNWQNAQLIIRKPVEEWVSLGVKIPKEDMVVEVTEIPVKSVRNKTAKNKRAGNKKALLIKKKQRPKKSVRQNTQQIAAQHLLNSPLPIKPIKVTAHEAQTQNEFPSVSGLAAIVLPQGWRGPAFMVFDNFDVMLDWNRSVNYALSVAQLAQRINGGPRVLGGQLAETGALTFEQMFELQATLDELGFDAGEPDGFPGLMTQRAIRTYQVEQHLPADGYASPSLLKSLMQTKALLLQDNTLAR
ncbi:MAG: lytic murein transglycosylase [Methylotenera sp.]|nr:lytic murein transglycosylase [Methylotenera sp.]